MVYFPVISGASSHNSRLIYGYWIRSHYCWVWWWQRGFFSFHFFINSGCRELCTRWCNMFKITEWIKIPWPCLVLQNTYNKKYVILQQVAKIKKWELTVLWKYSGGLFEESSTSPWLTTGVDLCILSSFGFFCIKFLWKLSSSSIGLSISSTLWFIPKALSQLVLVLRLSNNDGAIYVKP